MDSLDRFSLVPLEFSAVVGILKEFLSGPISHARLSDLGPSADLETIRQDLIRVSEAQRYAAESARPALGSLLEPAPLLEKLSIEGLSCESLQILALTH